MYSLGRRRIGPALDDISWRDGFKGLRKPEAYSNDIETDYWKLLGRFGKEDYKPSAHPHPVLGWEGMFDRETYFHQDGWRVGNRRPVLLYGDSFSACMEHVQCFEDILNADSAFTRDNFLLNYGVGGYGVCQSSLLCLKTASHFERPLVVFGLLTSDIDRTILPIRTGLKPYFDVEDGRLQLKGLPIDGNLETFAENNPVSFHSYLYRRFLHSELGTKLLPLGMRDRLKNRGYWIGKIKEVNALLIQKVAQELRARDIDFVFLIFHFEDDTFAATPEGSWRDAFLQKVMSDNQIPYLRSKPIIDRHRLSHPENSYGHYIDSVDWHPTTLYNELVAAEIKELALRHTSDWKPMQKRKFGGANREYYEVRIRENEAFLRSDSLLFRQAVYDATMGQRKLEDQIHITATYRMVDQMKAGDHFKGDSLYSGFE